MKKNTLSKLILKKETITLLSGDAQSIRGGVLPPKNTTTIRCTIDCGR